MMTNKLHKHTHLLVISHHMIDITFICDFENPRRKITSEFLDNPRNTILKKIFHTYTPTYPALFSPKSILGKKTKIKKKIKRCQIIKLCYILIQLKNDTTRQL